MSSNVLSLLEQMPHKSFTPINGQPNFRLCANLCTKIHANLMTVTTTAGRGSHGHLGSFLPPAKYLALPGTEAYEVPPNPGDGPVIANNATNQAIANATNTWKAAHARYTLHQEVLKSVKQGIIACIEPIYIERCRDRRIGFENQSGAELLQWIEAKYAIMTANDLAKNRLLLATPFDVDKGLDPRWTLVADVQYFAELGGEPIPDSAAINATIQVFDQARVYSNAVYQWNTNPPAQATMNAFILFMATAERERSPRERVAPLATMVLMQLNAILRALVLHLPTTLLLVARHLFPPTPHPKSILTQTTPTLMHEANVPAESLASSQADVVPTPLPTSIIADTGCTSHYFRIDAPVINK
ncbi:hypothetical protein MPSEU_000058200 [Mayamaea pseudoterrestris]|nr:hypothetical protein MPSEU_000058200 [Mayamaea pseudoterrestris]